MCVNLVRKKFSQSIHASNITLYILNILQFGQLYVNNAKNKKREPEWNIGCKKSIDGSEQ